jgi:hypothetical protein
MSLRAAPERKRARRRRRSRRKPGRRQKRRGPRQLRLLRRWPTLSSLRPPRPRRHRCRSRPRAHQRGAGLCQTRFTRCRWRGTSWPRFVSRASSPTRSTQSRARTCTSYEMSRCVITKKKKIVDDE